MREILFRGKSIEDGKWKYSMSLARHATEDGIITSYYIGSGYDIVKAETLGQYTGLTDKNGTKIFEGDIVLYDEEYGHIEYDDSDAQFLLSFDTWCTTFGIVDSRYVEVFGNKYDNPEMLKERERG